MRILLTLILATLPVRTVQLSPDIVERLIWCTYNMAGHLAVSQHHLIRDMILSRSLKQADMAPLAGCSDCSSDTL